MDLNLFKELQGKTISHWAEHLQSGDRCIATIRHKTDGSKNIIGANVIVVENQKLVKHIIAFYKSERFLIPYNDLKKSE